MTNETETILHAEALRREAVGFAEYLRINEWAFAIHSGDDWVKINEENELVFKTTSELYDLYRKEVGR